MTQRETPQLLKTSLIRAKPVDMLDFALFANCMMLKKSSSAVVVVEMKESMFFFILAHPFSASPLANLCVGSMCKRNTHFFVNISNQI